MKKTIIHIALIGLLGVGTVAFAQDSTTQDSGNAPAMQGGRRQGFNPDAQLARMTRSLNLSSDQQSQIKPLLENQQTQMQQIRQDQSLSREDKMTKVKSLHEDTNSKIEAVLNADQKQKFEQQEAKRQERMQRFHGGAGAGDAQQPQQ